MCLLYSPHKIFIACSGNNGLYILNVLHTAALSCLLSCTALVTLTGMYCTTYSVKVRTHIHTSCAKMICKSAELSVDPLTHTHFDMPKNECLHLFEGNLTWQ